MKRRLAAALRSWEPKLVWITAIVTCFGLHGPRQIGVIVLAAGWYIALLRLDAERVVHRIKLDTERATHHAALGAEQATRRAVQAVLDRERAVHIGRIAAAQRKAAGGREAPDGAA